MSEEAEGAEATGPTAPPRAARDLVARVSRFWFGGTVGPEHPWWFERSDELDARIAARFTADVEAAAEGRYDSLRHMPDGAVTLCILLDQFPRHIWRGTARAFATDTKALEVAQQAVDRGLDRSLLPVQKLFLYLPFEHAEDPAAQERAVALFEATGNARWIDYARRHQAIIAHFGRFPHRNAALGRPSTPEEEAFLRQPGSSF